MVAYRLQASSTDERYYLISDHLGTNAHQIKYSDSSRSSQYYLPFGGSRGVSGGGLDTDRTYTGQVSDEALTGLMFYNARYYDPLLRRFISPDTIVPDPGNPQDLNRYTYVRNNPVMYTDPSGHNPCLVPPVALWCVAAVGVVAAAAIAIVAEPLTSDAPPPDVDFELPGFEALGESLRELLGGTSDMPLDVASASDVMVPAPGTIPESVLDASSVWVLTPDALPVESQLTMAEIETINGVAGEWLRPDEFADAVIKDTRNKYRDSPTETGRHGSGLRAAARELRDLAKNRGYLDEIADKLRAKASQWEAQARQINHPTRRPGRR